MNRARRKPTAEEIAQMAERGDDVSRFFTNKGKIKLPVQRVNVDFTADMLKELDEMAGELNISRQAVMKSFIRQALDQHYAARNKTGNLVGRRAIPRRPNSAASRNGPPSVAPGRSKAKRRS